MDKPAIEGGKPIRDTLILFSKPSISEEEEEEVISTIKSGWLTMGPKTIEFEEKIKKYIGCDHIVSVNSCTAALHLSLLSSNITSGEVITSPLTFASTGNMIIHAGAKPVFADINQDTLNIDPIEIRRKITKKTKAIIPVHYAGQPCEMDEIMEIGREYNIKVIEDAAHAIGAKYKGRKIGTIGDMTCFSFYATKNMTTGEGGAIATNDANIAERAKLLRLHGITKDAWNRYSSEGNWHYEVKEAGWKYNTTDINSAIGIIQLKKLDNLIKIRREQASRYEKLLGEVTELFLTKEVRHNYHARHIFPIILNISKLKIDRSKFIRAMESEGIKTSVHFTPLHLQPLYKNMGYKKGDYPIAERIYNGLISLPIYPGLSEKDIDDTIITIKKIINYYRL